MIYLLYGADSYRRNKKLREYITGYLEKYPNGDLFIIDSEEEPDGLARARDFLKQLSLFSAPKIFIVKGDVWQSDISATKETVKEWKKILRDFLDEPRTFIFLSQEKKPNQMFNFLIKHPVTLFVFDELKGNKLESFIKKEARARDVSFSPNGFRFFCSLLSRVKEKSWETVQWLEQLHLAYTERSIDAEDVRMIVSAKGQDVVFSLAQNVFFSRGVPARLIALERLFVAADPAHAFNSLAYQARGGDILRFADYDISVKSGKLGYEEALLKFVVSSE